MSVEGGAKRTMPVPPPKPKFPTPPPKPAADPNGAPKTVSSPYNPDQKPSPGPGAGRGGHVLPPQPHLAHRRVVSASPTAGGSDSTSKTDSSPGPVPAKPAGAPPKVAPKPPSRPRSGAHQPTNPYETAKPSESDGDGAIARLTLAPDALKALADEFSVSSNELSSLQLLFIEMDTDNDGVISMADLLRYKYGSRKVVAMPEVKEEPDSPVAVQAPIGSGMMPSASAPLLAIQVKEYSGEEESDSEGETANEIGDILKGMDLSETSSSEVVPPPPASDSATQAEAATPKQGFSFRHIDFASLPQNTGEESSDDDNLLADWDGPADAGSDDEKDSDTKSTKSKSSSKLGSSGGFGSLKRKLSNKASMLAKKIGK